MFRHKKLLHFRKIKHICFLKKISFRIVTLNNIRSQQQYFAQNDLEDLTVEQRRILRQNNPQCPPTLFMTNQQKQTFFEETSQQFINRIQCSKPRVSKSKKIVKFLGKIQHIYDPNEQIVQNFDSQ